MNSKLYTFLIINFIITLCFDCLAQSFRISGQITNNAAPVAFANIYLKKTAIGNVSDEKGRYSISNIPEGRYTLVVSCLGYKNVEKIIQLSSDDKLDFELDVDDKKLQEFVVTGVSKATRIKENPLAVSTISLKNIEQSSENNIMDVVQKNTTGISMLKTGPNISKPFIRGLGYNRVLTLYDGIRQEGQQWGDEHGIEIDPYGIQNIEVIKGPASLMYGSDAVAGVVSFIPIAMDTTLKGLHGKLIHEYQNNNNLIGNGAYLFQHKKKLSFAIRSSYRIAKNYSNKVDGRVYNTGFQEFNWTGKMTYYFKNSHLNLNATIYHNIQGIPDGSRDSTTRKFTYQIFEGEFDDIKNRPLVSDEQLNSYTKADLHQQIKHYRIYANQVFQIEKCKLKYNVAYQRNIRKEITHPTDLDQPGLFVNLNTINYHLLFQLPEKNNRITAIGINGMWQQNKNDDATDFPVPNYQLFDVGLFAHHAVKFNKINVSGGLRLDVRSISIENLFIIKNTLTGFTEQTENNIKPESYYQYKAFTRSFNGMSGSVGVSYIASDNLHIKLNISRGYRSPSITELSSNGLDPGARIVYLGNPNFDAEFSNQQDLGVFFEHKMFDFSIGVFNNFMQNYIYLAQVVDANNIPITDNQGNRTFQYQQSAAQLYGFETSFNIHFEKLKGFSILNSFQMVQGFNREKSLEGKGIYGAYLPFIPPASCSSQLSQQFQIKKYNIHYVTPKVGCEYMSAQKRYMALYATETFTPSYFLLNASIQFEFLKVKNRQLNIHFFINNISNQVYQSNMSRLKYFEYYKDNRTNSNGIYNMGRNTGIKLVYNF